MFGRIPLPKFGHEIFAEGAHDILKNLMARRLKEQELEQQGEYQQGQLGLARQAETRQQQAENRAQQLLPFQINKFREDAARLAAQKRASEQFWGSGEGQNINPQNQQQMPVGVERQGSQFAQRDFSQQQGLPSEKNRPQIDLQDRQKRLDAGEKVMISPSQNPHLAPYDMRAGETEPYTGIRIPKIESRIVNGIQYDRYPSGKELAHKVGLSDQEKADIQTKSAINTAEAKLKAANNVKRTTEAETNFKTIHSAFNYLKQIKAQNDKNITGLQYGIPLIGKALYRSSENKGLGALEGSSTSLAGQYAKLEKSQPGIKLVEFFERTKPGLSNSMQINQGLIDSNVGKLKELFDTYKTQWEDSNPGKKFPEKEPNWSELQSANNGEITIVDSNGKEHNILEQNLDEAKKRDPGLKVKK